MTVVASRAVAVLRFGMANGLGHPRREAINGNRPTSKLSHLPVFLLLF